MIREPIHPDTAIIRRPSPGSGPASYQYPAGGCKTQNSLPSGSARICQRQPVPVTGWLVSRLADSRSGRQGGVLPWVLLVAGSVASLAANVAVAEPTFIGR